MVETIAHHIWGHYLPPTQPRNMSSAYITTMFSNFCLYT